MATWSSAELEAIGNADELRIQSRRVDGTLRKPVTIWVVRVGDGLYVRAVRGRTSPWFKGTQDQLDGRISSGGIARDVIFAPVDSSLDQAISAAFRAKYGRYPAAYVDPTVSDEAIAASISLEPR